MHQGHDNPAVLNSNDDQLIHENNVDLKIDGGANGSTAHDLKQAPADHHEDGEHVINKKIYTFFLFLLFYHKEWS